MRRVSRIFLLFSLSFATAGIACASDQLAMPFDCSLDGGRIRLSPAIEKHYAIVGSRDELAVTACRRQSSSDCRAVMVHRFVISCGGAGVAWMRVAAAIKRGGAAPTWIQGDRLNVMFPAPKAQAARAPCLDRPMFALGGAGLQRRVKLTGDCLSPQRRREFDHVVLPAGYAPVGELGARLILAASVGPSAWGDKRRIASLGPDLGARGETLVAKADPDSIVEPIPGLEPYDATFDQAVAGDAWVTVVSTEGGYGAKVRDRSTGTPETWTWLLAVMGLATMAALARVRFADARPAKPFAFLPRKAGAYPRSAASPPSAGTFQCSTNAGAALKAFLEQTEKVVADLKGAAPLREVLQSELRLVGQRLASVEAASAGDENGAVKNAPHYRALVRELERIHRIADSAAASLSGARQASGPPRTVSEAYDVLGVNADVSESVLKKIVDALRMSWHPDLCRDEEDRQLREDRIRQINIAWELINAKRDVAA